MQYIRDDAGNSSGFAHGPRRAKIAGMKHVLLGITGSIAAYKAADIASQLVKAGCKVTCIMTKDAQQFVTALTLQTLAHRSPTICRRTR